MFPHAAAVAGGNGGLTDHAMARQGPPKRADIHADQINSRQPGSTGVGHANFARDNLPHNIGVRHARVQQIPCAQKNAVPLGVS